MKRGDHILIWIYVFFSFSTNFLNANHIATPELLGEELYSQTKPFNKGVLQVSELHRIYFSEFGNPKGKPVLVVHGGPGGGCEDSWSAFFNPESYHVIMFDQRGAKRSTPFAEMRENTPQHSISDMETLRLHLGIDTWTLFGGSWGSALSLLYAEQFPERVRGLVLRGVFLAREKDYLHLFYGMRDVYPEAWEEMIEMAGADEETDLIPFFYEKVMDPRRDVHFNAACAFMLFDTKCAFLLPNQEAQDSIRSNEQLTIGVGRAFIHYAVNRFFVDENQILNNISKIAHIPTIIVQGRYDMICPMKEAYELHKNLPNSELWIIPDAGHSSAEPSIGKALKKAMDEIFEKV